MRNENSFLAFVDDTIGNSVLTENGALAYKTTNDYLVDCNFSVSTWRSAEPEEKIQMFEKAYSEDENLAIIWLFYLRDPRGGLGERDSFRDLATWVIKTHPDVAEKVLDLIPYYGRWDDVVELAAATDNQRLIDFITFSFCEDLAKSTVGKYDEISLLAKWMPSENASSSHTRALARKVIKWLGITPRKYRQSLSELRRSLKLVENDLREKNYANINYDTVPAKANLKYSKAFIKKDTDRRIEFLNNPENMKIQTLSPYEILHNFCRDRDSVGRDLAAKMYDPVWDRFLQEGSPEMGLEDTLVVVDGSGSMWTPIPNSTITCVEIARGLGMYFSQKMTGPFKDKVIEFARNPQWIDLSPYDTMSAKYEYLEEFTDCWNTDIKKVFDLILTALKSDNVDPAEVPKNVLIVSDMEFDCIIPDRDCISYNNYPLRMSDDEAIEIWDKLFVQISKIWDAAGYKLPKLIFWNVSVNKEAKIPLTESDNGLALLSGFSNNAIKASEELTPAESLMKVLMSDRYSMVRARLVLS